MTPLVEELIPCPDPWDVARKLAHLPHLLFLDSAEQHPDRGRYSYVTADPNPWRLHPADPYALEGPRYGILNFIEWFPPDHFPQFEHQPDLPPFQAGYAGLWGYDLNREIEEIPYSGPSSSEVYYAIGSFDWVISVDHALQRGWIISTGLPEKDRDRRKRRARRRLNEVRRWLAANLSPLPTMSQVASQDFVGTQHPLPNFPGVTSNFSPAGYRDAVRRAVEYVHAGDCFQVNLSQRLLAPLTEHPLELYGRLRTLNPAPYACYFDAGEFQIVSASPEQFLRVSPGGEVVTRPIKGTRRRGTTPQEDAALIEELRASPKDRAENVMIVDLLRNDLGRVCEYGSISVPRVCDVETYRYVHHLVSEVRGKLRPWMTPFDLLRAAFPGGSVTGAPKVRAMEIIAELEPTARGPYCGSVGFVGFDGAMDSNILIRTFTAGRGWLQFPVGGGIVADSDPDREYEETLHKAAGLLKALRP